MHTRHANKQTKHLYQQLEMDFLKQTLPLKRVTIFNQDAGSVFMIAYGTKMTCIPLNKLYNATMKTIKIQQKT